MDYANIDRDLDALGKVPGDTTALIARYAGRDLSLAAVDAALADLQNGVTLAATPPQLQPTVVDMPVPAQEAQLAAAVAGDATQDESASDNTAVARDPRGQRPSEPASRSRLPWESDVPPASAQANADAEAISLPPRVEPDFAALFSSDADADADADAARIAGDASDGAPSSQPPTTAMPSSRASRPRHDTIRDVHASVLLKNLAPDQALELADLDKVLSQPPAEPSARPLSVMPASFGGDEHAPADASADAAAEPSAATTSDEDQADEFEILVDDEILEIDEGDEGDEV